MIYINILFPRDYNREVRCRNPCRLCGEESSLFSSDEINSFERMSIIILNDETNESNAPRRELRPPSSRVALNYTPTRYPDRRCPLFQEVRPTCARAYDINPIKNHVTLQ